jgi:type VI protein secretion system component VasK
MNRQRVAPIMLLPRFSIRFLLVAAIAVAIFALVLRQAAIGQAWALSVSIAVASLVLNFVVFWLLFCLAQVFARLDRRSQPAGDAQMSPLKAQELRDA